MIHIYNKVSIRERVEENVGRECRVWGGARNRVGDMSLCFVGRVAVVNIGCNRVRYVF